MFEQLLSIVKEQAGAAIIENPDIPNERNDEAVTDVTNSISGGLQQAFAGGQLKDLLKLIGGKGGNLETNPLASNISGNAITSLMEKFNLNQGQAGSIVSSLLPGVLNKFIAKTNDPSDGSLNLQGILSSLTGGGNNGLDLQGLLGNLSKAGLDQDGDNDTDLNDIIKMIKGGNSQQTGGGGMLDMVKGLFGK